MTGDPPAAQASTPRRGRLTKAAEFDAVTQLGRSVGGRYLTLRYRAAEGGSQARITWSWFSQTARSLWSRRGWRRQWLALPLSPRALGYQSVGSSSCAHGSIRF